METWPLLFQNICIREIYSYYYEKTIQIRKGD